MLLDYIPVYYPETNQWSIPGREIETYHDYDPEPQEMTLYKGAVIRGIPLVHFGTWGIFGVNVTECLRDFATNPDETAKRSYKSKKTAAEVSAFFRELVNRYPEIVHVQAFPVLGDDCEGLHVPECCVVKPVPPEKKRRRAKP